MGIGDTPQIQDPTRSLRRTLQNCMGDICQCLADKIDELANNVTTHARGTKGLGQRFAEQVAEGASGPGTDSWNNHEQIIQDQQNNLEKHIQEFDDRGCGPGTPLPVGAREWAERPVPSPAEWEANNPRYTGLTGSVAGDAAAVAGTVGLGYLIYRGVRMLPSLAPPLWWTIPANAAIP